MATYHYQHGDRPLDGYTIQYALGRGGFGEVYFAVSDSGREVALKAVQNFEEVELRGIGHCMNLKSPQLVMIFDVRHAADGTPWVIMEYVSGPSLRDVLDESPNGLGTEQTKFFLKELAKGLSYLHEAGVVHRDLKPHNVFFEDGIVKIGDYSLSKVITASHRSGNTMTVGSVHYMAPEISLGRYDKTVDIYALGVMLHEMLTGTPPYVGQSLGEVLMKHLSSEPDVSQLEEPFASAIVKAMQRDPADRYQTAQEMVEAVCGAAPAVVEESDFNPATLSLIGERARAAKANVPAYAAVSGNPSSSSDPYVRNQETNVPGSSGDLSPKTPTEDSQADELSHSTAPTVMQETSEYLDSAREARRSRTLGALNRLCFYYQPPLRRHTEPDPLPLGLRMLCAIVVTVVLITVGFRMQYYGAPRPDVVVGATLVTLLISSIAAFISVVTLPRHGGIGWAVLSRIGWSATMFIVMAFMIASGFPSNPGVPLLWSMGATTLVFDWRCLVAPHRRYRLSIVPVLAIGAVAVVVNCLLSYRAEWTPFAGAAIMAAAITVQLTAPVRKAAANAPLLQRPGKRDRPKKPRLLYDKTAMLLELVIGATVAIIIGLFIMGEDDGELIAVGCVAGMVGLFALRFRLHRRAWPEGHPDTSQRSRIHGKPFTSGEYAEGNPSRLFLPVVVDKTSIFLEFLILSAIAVLIAVIAEGDDDLFPVGAGAVGVVLLALRYRLLRRRRRLSPQKSGKLPLAYDRTSVVLEVLIGACVVGVTAALYFGLGYRNEEPLIFAAVCGIAGVIALRFRLARRLNIETNTTAREQVQPAKTMTP